MKNLFKLLKKYKLRKVAIALYMFTCFCILLGAGLLSGPIFAELGKALILAIFAANTLEHYAKSKK